MDGGFYSPLLFLLRSISDIRPGQGLVSQTVPHHSLSLFVEDGNSIYGNLEIQEVVVDLDFTKIF
jgi:hypothetical protein